ncbi:PREDICTED: protein yippee-like 1 [Bison bison bison]|uniref:Protein yippee-like n=1 Tax=Bison bison bison TaxID=43346 RepID=A0A6P3H4R8_BISBB|nr:PREDICTED: protein yippee-like 1 [Bison bison bison]
MFQCFFCWRAQQSCSSSRASPELSQECPAMVKMTKSKTFQAYLPNCHRTYSCVHCRAHLANHDELISKASVCSRNQGPMRRGIWTLPGVLTLNVCSLVGGTDIYCENCKTTLGWKYEHAFESSQKYKEGKFIIELAHMIKDNGWE